MLSLGGATAGIGIIRSLGAAGYRVHAAATDPAALGMRSRYAAERVVHPPTTSPEFAEWLADYVDRRQISMIMPGWDIGLFRRPALSHLAKLVPVSSALPFWRLGDRRYGLFLRMREGDNICKSICRCL